MFAFMYADLDMESILRMTLELFVLSCLIGLSLVIAAIPQRAVEAVPVVAKAVVTQPLSIIIDQQHLFRSACARYPAV